MAMRKGHSPEVVSSNIKDMVRSGMKPKAAIAASLASARKYKKMSDGGMVDENEPGEMEIQGAGLPKNEPMAEMDRPGEGSADRGLFELEQDAKYYPGEVANPAEMEEGQGFAGALRRKMMGEMSPENYAMGGLVQAGPEEDEKLHGNHPEDIADQPAKEDMDSVPQGGGLEHSKMMDPSGPGLSEDAKDAIRRKRMSRRYGSYDPR